jgi:hypothetical protein
LKKFFALQVFLFPRFIGRAKKKKCHAKKKSVMQKKFFCKNFLLCRFFYFPNL